MKAIEIIEGHINLLLKKAALLPEEIQQLGDLRMDLCKVCHTLPKPGAVEPGPGLDNEKYCSKPRGGCGCDMTAKTLALGSRCPIGRW
jgi:hypothetical protein